jgi:hypothetical protein
MTFVKKFTNGYDACLGQCGKSTNNVSGYCRDCRQFKCKVCGAHDSWNTFPKVLCKKCVAKRADAARSVSHINQY